MTLISDAAEASGLHQGYAVGVTNMAWAAAQVLGGVAGAAIAGVTGDAAPSIAIAVLLVRDDRLCLPRADPAAGRRRGLSAGRGLGAGRPRRAAAILLAVDPLRQNGEWANWAGDQRCRPARVVAPRSREELAEVVGAAAAAGEKVSVTGSGHSFTEAAMTDADDAAAGRAARGARRRPRERPGPGRRRAPCSPT